MDFDMQLYNDMLDSIDEKVETKNNKDRIKALIVAANMLYTADGSDKKALLLLISALVTTIIATEGLDSEDMMSGDSDVRVNQLVSFMEETLGLKIF